jgi:hypothetical protein
MDSLPPGRRNSAPNGFKMTLCVPKSTAVKGIDRITKGNKAGISVFMHRSIPAAVACRTVLQSKIKMPIAKN